MIISKIDNPADAAIARLVQQFKDKTKLEGFIRSFIQPMQALEDTLAQIGTFTNIYTATGKQLDLMGAIVGEQRKGKNDFFYRIAIFARIAINTSKGTPENAIEIFSLITGATVVHLLEYFPGVVEIYGNVNFEYGYEFLGPDSFAFEGGIDGLGFGDVFDPDIGGVFVGLILYDVGALYHLIDSVLAGGVRLDALGWFDDTPFSFEGDPNGKGFGDVFDSTIGEDFAKIVPP